MKFAQILIIGLAAVAVVGCSSLDEPAPWEEASDHAMVPGEGEVPRAELVAEPEKEEVAAELAEIDRGEPVEEVVKKKRRGWWPFGGGGEEPEVVAGGVEGPAVAAPAVRDGVPEVVEPQGVAAGAELGGGGGVGMAMVEAVREESEAKKKAGRRWWPFGRGGDEAESVAVVGDAGGEGVMEPEEEVEVEAKKPEPKRAVEELAWERRFPGVDLAEIERSEPRLMKGWAVRVNAGDVEWKVTEGNGELEGDTGGLRTSTFLQDYRCDLAVNGAPFSPVELFENQPQDIIGLQVSNGVVVSRADSKKPVLALAEDGRGRVLEAGSYGDGSGLWDAVAGFSVVLRDGNVVGSDGEVHPRTAAGVSRDGGTVYLLVIDGRQPGYSEGATTADLGRMLDELGAWDGINLDGGGTTTLVAKGAGGKAEVLNRTINGGIPGLERVSASHLGLRVK